MIIDRLKRLVYGADASKYDNAADYAYTEDMEEALRYFEKYGETDFNITAIIANKLANIVCAEASVSVPEDERLEAAVKACAGGLRRDTAEAFGTGGVVLRPYVSNGVIYTERIPQSRYFIVKRHGERIIKAGFVAEERAKGGGHRLTRLETHELTDEGTYIIENRAFEGEREVSLSTVYDWAGIAPRTAIDGVGQMLFALLKSPIVMRGADYSCVYGAPVTYGQERLMDMVLELLNEVPFEYRNKRAFIGAEDLLFDSRDRLPENGVYKLLRGSGGDGRSFWEVFSPEIRHTSYFEGLDYLFGLLEKGISVNKGVLTDMDSTDATATAIRRSMFDTYNLVDAMRSNIEKAYRELVYAYGVLEGCGDVMRETNDVSERDEVTASKANDVRFDWSYALLEDTSETFSQLMEGFNAGFVTEEEVRRFVF